MSSAEPYVYIACDGKTFDEIARETTQTLDAYIARTLADEERWALEQGFPPHVVDRQMRQYRNQVMAVRDAWLEERRAWLKEWL